MNIEIDRIAIWQPILADKLNVHSHPRKTPYQEKGSDEIQYSQEPIYRYAKNYNHGDIRFSLIVRSFTSNKAKVEKELDKVATSLDDTTILEALTAATISNFTYTDNYLTKGK